MTDHNTSTSTSSAYPWVEHTPDKPEDYLAPNYYDLILKDYAFSGRTDLELLGEYVDTIPAGKNMLELGCGSGRATDQLLSGVTPSKLDLVDLSEGMVERCRSKYAELGFVAVHRSDSVDFLGNSQESYASAISMWNLSHSVHQHMFRLGRKAGAEHVGRALTKFVTTNLEAEGSMYLIHYDIQSPEQRLINPWRLSLWKEADPTYDASGQSPSKELLDSVFGQLACDGYIDFDVAHLTGDPIEYEDANLALETFLNFHMEGHFNTRKEFPQVVDSLLSGFEPYTDTDGSVHIAPGAFKYEVVRTGKVNSAVS